MPKIKALILIAGKPGSGKTTLLKMADDKQVDLGDFRTMDCSDELKKYKSLCGDESILVKMRSGELLEASLVNKIIRQSLQDVEERVLLLSGFPRNLEQREFLTDILKSNDNNLSEAQLFIISVDVTDEVALQRMSDRGRGDDSNASVRLKYYQGLRETKFDEHISSHAQREVKLISIDNSLVQKEDFVKRCREVLESIRDEIS